jgi:hypothetical protein
VQTGVVPVRPEHLETAVRVHLVVVFEPAIELGQERSGVGPSAEPNVIALEGFHERLGDAVRLRAAHGREARHEAADGVSEGDRLVGREQLPLSASHSPG